MTDLTPNDLSHLSDEKFNALCPQGEHAPGPEPLSPAAQAVSNAAKSSLDWEAGYLPNAVAAAALRAAAARSEVVEICTGEAMTEFDYIIRPSDILAIAAELENQ